jgi:hypothetical protein
MSKLGGTAGEQTIPAPIVEVRDSDQKNSTISISKKIGWGVSRNDNTAAPGNGASAYWTTYRTNFGTIEPYTFFLRRDFVQVY